MAMTTSKVIPMLRIFNVEKALEFYRDWLGFEIEWENKPLNTPMYIQIRKDNITLHLTEHHGDCCPGSKVFIEVVVGLRTYHEELILKNYKYNRPGLEVAPWNALTMEVVDPFGNKLLFSESLPQKIRFNSPVIPCTS